MALHLENMWHDLLKDVEIADRLKFSEESKLVLNDLELTLKNSLPRLICLHPFGSRTMGVAVSSSDMDIYVEIGMDMLSPKSRQDRITNAICKYPLTWKHLGNYGGRCPIVKAEHKATGIQCDISFKTSVTVAQNKLVSYIFELQPIARYMVIYLRGWAMKVDLKDSFRTHIITLMVIYFLQVNRSLPSIKQLQKNQTPSIGKWITGFNYYPLSKFGMHEIVLEKSATIDILKKYFGFYSNFNFSKHAISSYLGKIVSRTELFSQMPYKCSDPWRNFAKSGMVVQEFLSLDINKGELITKVEVEKFVKLCKLNL